MLSKYGVSKPSLKMDNQQIKTKTENVSNEVSINYVTFLIDPIL